MEASLEWNDGAWTSWDTVTVLLFVVPILLTVFRSRIPTDTPGQRRVARALMVVRIALFALAIGNALIVGAWNL